MKLARGPWGVNGRLEPDGESLRLARTCKNQRPRFRARPSYRQRGSRPRGTTGPSARAKKHACVLVPLIHGTPCSLRRGLPAVAA